MQGSWWLAILILWSGVVSSAQPFYPQGECTVGIEYAHYTLCYEPEHRQSSWAKHELTLEKINGSQKRTNDYRADLAIEDAVTENDYRGSGFDRGHLVPAADMKLNREMMSATFLMTNMSPQRSSFNSGVWARVESQIRKNVRAWGDAHVITAPWLTQGMDQISSGVSVPTAYYKIAYFPHANVMKAYWLENRGVSSSVSLDEFLISVDEIEVRTGFDFFSELPDDVEDSLESQI